MASVRKLVRAVVEAPPSDRSWSRSARALRRLDRYHRRHPADRAAVDLVWRRWLAADSDPRLWTLLEHWGQPGRDELGAIGRTLLASAELTGRDLVDAFRYGGPAAGAARALIREAAPERLDDVFTAILHLAWPADAEAPARFCLEYGLVPADPARAAMFRLVAGDLVGYRAHDPDGSLLAVGYAAGDATLRTVLRSAMVGVGDLDLLRVILGSEPARLGDATPYEIDYLGSELAEQEDWSGLWQVITSVSPVRAVTLARRLPADWLPPARRGERLLGALRAATDDVLELLATPYRPAGALDLGGAEHRVVSCVAFTPAGNAVAVLSRPAWAGTPDDVRLQVFDLPGGDLRWQVVADVDGPLRDAFRLVCEDADSVLVSGSDLIRVVRDGSPAGDGRIQFGTGMQLAPLRDGWLAVGRFAPTALYRCVHGELELHAFGPATSVSALATHRPTGRVAAVLGEYDETELLLLDADLTVLARQPFTPAPNRIGMGVTGLAFTGPDSLVMVSGWDQVMPWRHVAGGLQLGSTVDASRGLLGEGQGKLVVAAGRLIVRGPDWLSARTLEPAGRLVDEVAGRRHLWAAPDGTYLAAPGNRPSVQVYRAAIPAWAVELAEVPAALYTGADLPTAVEAPADDPVAAGALGLVMACLLHHVGDEIELGDGLVVGDFDIGL